MILRALPFVAVPENYVNATEARIEGRKRERPKGGGRLVALNYIVVRNELE